MANPALKSTSSLRLDPAGPTRGSPTWQRVFRWSTYINNLLLVPMFTVLVLETGTGGTKGGLGYAQANAVFCACFLFEYFLGLALAGDRRVYLKDPARLTDLISSIPFGYLFQGLRAVRLLRLLRVARVMWRARRFRGKGAQLIRAVGMVASLTFAGAMALRIVEPHTTRGLFEAVWWSLVTLSTVGYGDVMPVTSAGRAIAMSLIVSGIGVFGFMAGFMSSLMQDPEEDEILAAVKRIESRLDELQAAALMSPPSARVDGPSESKAAVDWT